MDQENKITRCEPAPQVQEGRHRPLLLPPEMIDVEQPSDLLIRWRVIRKRRWAVLTIFLILDTVVLIVTLKQKPNNRAGA
jgi:hypothetical protein